MQLTALAAATKVNSVSLPSFHMQAPGTITQCAPPKPQAAATGNYTTLGMPMGNNLSRQEALQNVMHARHCKSLIVQQHPHPLRGQTCAGCRQQ